jgi:hypothetical protein
MQGDATVIQHLNAVLRSEMTAVNQYFLHARMLDHWGAVKLGAREYEESIPRPSSGSQQSASPQNSQVAPVRLQFRGKAEITVPAEEFEPSAEL